MYLDGVFADADVGRNLLIKAPFDNAFDDLPFARSERLELSAEIGKLVPVKSCLAVSLEGSRNRFKQILISKRLGQKLNSACFHRANGHGNVGMAGKEDDRKPIVRIGHFALNIETAQAR